MIQSGKEQEMRRTIARLKERNSSETQHTEQADSKARANRLRATSDGHRIEPVARASFIRSVIHQLILGELSQGEALRLLRIEVLGLKQDKYALLVGVSRKTISDIENNKGNYSVEVINKVFKPFGLKLGLIPIPASLLDSLLNDSPDNKT